MFDWYGHLEVQYWIERKNFTPSKTHDATQAQPGMLRHDAAYLSKYSHFGRASRVQLMAHRSMRMDLKYRPSQTYAG